MGIVKLPSHPVRTGRGTAGLPGNVISFILCPFLPAGRQIPRLQGRDGARSGHLKVQSGIIIVIAILLRLCYVS